MHVGCLSTQGCQVQGLPHQLAALQAQGPLGLDQMYLLPLPLLLLPLSLPPTPCLLLPRPLRSPALRPR